MGYYWIGFTLIWITFYQKELTSAASLRSESPDFSPVDIGITKSHTEENLPLENSNYYQKNHGNQRHRTRLPYERRNRQIYTSKTFFGRNQQIDLPRKYGINKQGTDAEPLRRKSARYMYPEEPRHLAPQDYDNSALNYEQVIHQPSLQIPIAQDNFNRVHGLDLNYNPNLEKAARTEYGLNPGQDSGTGLVLNPQYVKYDARPEQNPNVLFGQVPAYQTNDGYPVHGQNYGFNIHDGYGQESKHHDNAGMAQDLRYGPNVRQGQVLGYGPNVRQEQDLGYGPNVRQEQDLVYGPNVRQEQVLGYDPNGRQEQVLGYNPNAGYGQAVGHNSNAGIRQNLEYDTNRNNVGNRQDPRYGIVGHLQDPVYDNHAHQGHYHGYNVAAGSRQDHGYANVGHVQDPGYVDPAQQVVDPGYVATGIRQDTINTNAGYGQDPVYANIQQVQDHGYNAMIGNRQDSRYANSGNGQDPVYVNHVPEVQDHGYNDMTEPRQNNGYPIKPENVHDSGQNIFDGYGSNGQNANTGYDSKLEYGTKTYDIGVTNDDSMEENVDSRNDVFKHKDHKKDVLRKEEDKKTNAHTLENKESKEDKEQKYILNNDDHIKILNVYNQLRLSEKQKDSQFNENTETTSIAPNSNFISDENLEKDKLLRNLPKESIFKQSPSDSVGTELKDPKSTFLEEIEGSGDVESFNEHLRTSDQESKKSPRILEIFSRTNNSNQCLTPKNESGHCLGLTQCPLIETTENFSTFLQYMCFQQSRLVGICCPDNPVIEISDPLDENSTKQEKVDIEQPSEGCGLSTNTRIVGGTMSIPHEFSWMVALLRRGRFYCGGVIINNWYILTAAHCVLGIKVGDLKVRLGEFDFHKTTDHQRDIPVAEIKRHALFVTLTFQHDIALLKLRRKIEYTKFIGSICLPNKDEGDFTARNATVVGWGTVSFGGAASPILRKVTVPVWDNKQCDRTYVFERINEAFMCAGSPENGEDACQGDSGGPLMTMNDDNRWSVIGIVSWGRRCGDPTYPGVYTRVTSYLDWIAENAQ